MIKSSVSNPECIFALFRNVLLQTSSEIVKEHYMPQTGRHLVNPSTGVTWWPSNWR